MVYPGNIPGESNALMVQIPCIVFFVVTPIFVGIRIWSRIRLRSGISWDDWTILLSFVGRFLPPKLREDLYTRDSRLTQNRQLAFQQFCTMIVAILMMVSCHYGFGKHIKDLSVPNKLMTLKTFYVAQIFYKMTINLTKASILLLFLRIFVQRWFRTTCYTLLSIILAYMVATTCSSIFQCSPIPRAWNRTIDGTCISLTMNWNANAGFSIATDIIILFLPQYPIWKSKLPVSQKRALMGVFALGGFVTVTSVLRATTLNFSTTSPDTTYDIASTLWTMIEMHVAIVCACLPMCKLPLTYVFPKVFSAVSGSSAPSDGRSNPHSDSSRGGAGSGSHSRHEWSGYTSKKEQLSKGGLHLASVSTTTRTGDDTSEEYMLETVARSHGPEDVEKGA
ncbi:unnamed protein product [Parascedosporium putredinis]|uniref:Rhodopsin domain-containing protein n=1 Tax=Parascedosporium putredinis TaxID=1442378 RepID=A0A9P1GZS6_9PEZI|nr:unnamed protein product [Parascedosporium putredinis]CAI7991086.1 unnamed protein product [Parascedosporium putredinis]